MKLIVGLGNPGRDYAGTRHNVGFEVVDLLAARHGGAWEAAKVDAVTARLRMPDGEPVLLVKPLTYMNLSGEAVQGLAHYFRIDVPDILIVADDVNLPLGRLRARKTGTEGGHNGLRSVAQILGTIDYPRLRVGVGRPRGPEGAPGDDSRRELADHVLSRFDADEIPGIEAAIARAADAAETFVADGIDVVMNRFNRSDLDT
ncbi:MAG TPA: aminoacyl-tRNA hydrolase [Vicinamibacterales bacterium]|nr:aminoacyl-tRNA hydrolase [Vicinamibacterales bacterium]